MGTMAMLGLLLLVIIHSATPDIVFGGKAAGVSSTTTCGCQCSSLGFRGSDGSLQGNCLSSDSVSGAWCYVDTTCTSCGDLRPSDRFHGHAWSYQACGTSQGASQGISQGISRQRGISREKGTSQGRGTSQDRGTSQGREISRARETSNGKGISRNKSQFQRKKDDVKFSESRIGRLSSESVSTQPTQVTQEEGLVGILADIINTDNR